MAAVEILPLASSSPAVSVIEHRCIQIIETVQYFSLSCIKCSEIDFYFNENNAKGCKEIWLKAGYFEKFSIHFPLLPVISIVGAKKAQSGTENILGNIRNETMVVIWLETLEEDSPNISEELQSQHYQLQNTGKVMLIFGELTNEFNFSTVTQNTSIIIASEFENGLVHIYRLTRINASTMVKTFLCSVGQTITNTNNSPEKSGCKCFCCCCTLTGIGIKNVGNFGAVLPFS